MPTRSPRNPLYPSFKALPEPLVEIPLDFVGLSLRRLEISAIVTTYTHM